MSLEFKVLTLNCWGIPYVSKDRKNRMKAIACYLKNSEYDVVCLQEVWTDGDFDLIKNESSNIYPYVHYFYSGVIGSGLCILSKHVIEEAFFHQWSLNGYIHKIHHGDWFGGKGVGLCKLTVNNFNVNIYTAHLHAEYNRNSDEYEAHRVLQAFDTAQFILLTSRGVDLVVLAGDLNTMPGDLAYKVIKTVPGLMDSYECCREPIEDSSTCESPRNSYTQRKSHGQRIDYILYHPGAKLQVALKSYDLPLPDRVPCCPYSYSDHEAVEATLEIGEAPIKHAAQKENETETVLRDSLAVLNKALNDLASSRICYGFVFVVLSCVLVVSFAFGVPPGYSVIYDFARVLLTIFAAFFLLMATIWVKIERHGLLAGKLAMEISLKKLS
ncbi:unnamed protein product [Phyllotreta striolata]|uniref:sphingomyelin phosphodiesterase n=1 Tax=Phyllotreta striolata TaxID=444603 RepID=A0A9N9TYD5_PHYSR|nr:unnamed protein product [Phyllotreta striolata]